MASSSGVPRHQHCEFTAQIAWSVVIMIRDGEKTMLVMMVRVPTTSRQPRTLTSILRIEFQRPTCERGRLRLLRKYTIAQTAVVTVVVVRYTE